MNAVRIHSFGGPEVMAVDSVADPVPDRDELLVETRAAGYNPMDRMLRDGELEPDGSLPTILGGDVAGIVRECGSEVSRFDAGDAVFGTTRSQTSGAYAEYAVATPETLARKPKSVDFAAAAAIPTVGLTARQAVHERAAVTADDRVLVQGGAGGVGSFAVQFAANAGATVFATAAADDLDYVEALGAREAFDYHGSYDAELADIDVVIDPVGGDARRRSWDLLAPDGVLVTTTAPDPQPAASRHDRRGDLFFVDVDATQLSEIAAAVDAGDLTVTVGETYPLSAAATMHDVADSERAPRGKLVLSMDQ